MSVREKVKEEAMKTAARGKTAVKVDTDSIPKIIGFDTDLLPNGVRQYATDIAERMDHAPISFAAVSAMMVLSASIGRSVGVRVKQADDWTESPNLWGALIAPPSIKKSPILKEVVKPLRIAESKANEAYNDEVRQYAEELVQYDVEMKAYKKALESGKGEASFPTKPDKPARKRLMVQDATIEAVVEIMVDNPNGLLVLLDELSGFFATLRMNGRERDRTFWLEAFSIGKNITVDRIQRGSFMVPYVCAGVFGTIQPDKISPLIDDSKTGGGGGDGLLQRFQMMVWEDDSNYVYTDRSPNKQARDTYYDLVDKLVNAAPLEFGAFKDDFSDEYFFRFAPEATEVFKRWSKSNHKKIQDESEHNIALSAHFGKYPSLFASIALILFYADKISGTITDKYIPESYAIKSEKWCDFLEVHARKIYDLQRIHEAKKESLHEKIIEKVKELQIKGELPISYGGLSQKINGANAADCRKALKSIAVEKQNKIYGVQQI